MMEEREQLRFTILSLVVAVILLALLLLACALALGFHLQKRTNLGARRSKRRKPVRRTDSFASTTSTILMDLDSPTSSCSSLDSVGQKQIQPIFLL